LSDVAGLGWARRFRKFFRVATLRTNLIQGNYTAGDISGRYFVSSLNIELYVTEGNGSAYK